MAQKRPSDDRVYHSEPVIDEIIRHNVERAEKKARREKEERETDRLVRWSTHGSNPRIAKLAAQVDAANKRVKKAGATLVAVGHIPGVQGNPINRAFAYYRYIQALHKSHLASHRLETSGNGGTDKWLRAAQEESGPLVQWARREYENTRDAIRFTPGTQIAFGGVLAKTA